MILQSLVQYYEALRVKGEVTSPGWCEAKVSFALSISEEGELIAVMPLKQTVTQGKKDVLRPQKITVPQMLSRSSGIAPNFLCDNTTYIIGIDNKGKPARSKECFEAAKARHLEVLENAESAAAKAVKNYFRSWNTEKAEVHPLLEPYLDEMMAGANLIFSTKAGYAHEDAVVRKSWENSSRSQEKETSGICLVTGERTAISRTHGTIQGVQGAQSSGAALVSFNAPSFESYGREQSFNAPVGEYAVYAYTTVLSKLLADKKYSRTIGDTTIVYWAENGEESYQNVFTAMAEPTAENQEVINGVFKNLEMGRAVAVENVQETLSFEQRFHILGLSPNAARIAVRFFYQDSFGNILKNIRAHYKRMEIVRPSMDNVEYLGVWRMLQETVNKKSREKKPVASMAGSVYRAIVSGDRYPYALYQAVLGRIRAEQDDKDNHIFKITRGRAAIIKAFLIRNGTMKKEEITMALNEESCNVAYILGREFAVLEFIQKKANPEINATIKDRYFNSACSTPAIIFPILFRLKNSHIRKLNIGQKIVYEELLGSIQDKLTVTDEGGNTLPNRLNLEEQGMFVLGYYHQMQKRYEKKTKEDN